MGLTPEASSSRLQIPKSRQFRNSSTSKGGDDPETIPSFSDSEILKYLNNKKEIHYKRIIWEAMNKDYLKGNKQKKAKKEKKADTTKKVAKPKHKVDNTKRSSSKINYDMLEKQDHEDEVNKIAKVDATKLQRIDIQSKNENSHFEANSSGHNPDDECLHENEYTGIEDDDVVQDDYGITDTGIEDDFVDCDEEYGFEEY